MRLSPRPARNGITLLEVLAALVIFVLSFTALAGLIHLASERALDIQRQTLAVQMCQSKLAEVIAGVVPLQSQSGTIDEDPDWTWNLEAEQADVTNLWNVTVRVSRPTEMGEVSVTLSARVLDPAIRGSAADQPTVSGQDATTTDSTSSSPSSGTSAAGGGGQAASTPAASPAPASTGGGGGGGGRATTGGGRP